MQPTRRNFLLAGAVALAEVPVAKAAPARAKKWMPKLSENLADFSTTRTACGVS